MTGFGRKNGRELADVHLDSGADHWGYLDQFQPIAPTCACSEEDGSADRHGNCAHVSRWRVA